MLIWMAEIFLLKIAVFSDLDSSSSIIVLWTKRKQDVHKLISVWKIMTEPLKIKFRACKIYLTCDNFTAGFLPLVTLPWTFFIGKKLNGKKVQNKLHFLYKLAQLVI